MAAGFDQQPAAGGSRVLTSGKVDQEAEVERVQLLLTQQANGDTPDPVVAASLVTRMEELAISLPSERSDTPALAAAEASEGLSLSIGRDAEFVHQGGEGTQDLVAVAEAVIAWASSWVSKGHDKRAQAGEGSKEQEQQEQPQQEECPVEPRDRC